MKHLFPIILLLLSPLCLEAVANQVDLGFTTGDIFFDVEEPLVAGDHIRLYARVHNYGEVDVQGYVEFFQGAIPVDQSQVISVRAGGVPEEVFVDFVVPSGTFNIRADIKATDPQDENPDNDSVMTKLYSPVFDDDRDGVVNSHDNCPDRVNPDQTDSDSDGLGDVCDDDDDNDGVSDDVENEIGSNPTTVDTDSDGIKDPHDAYPNDEKQTQIPVNLEDLFSELITELDTGLMGTASTDLIASAAAEEELSSAVIVSGLEFSPKAIFSYSREAWNKFNFKALTPEVTGYLFEWDFADGVYSNRHSPDHEYQDYGNFEVSLRITGPDGAVSEDTTIVSVPFFTLNNRLIVILIGLLSLLLLFGLVFTARMSFMPKRKKTELVATPLVEEPEIANTIPEPKKETVVDQPEKKFVTPDKPQKRAPVKQISIRDGDLED